jgi:hypothetical protein
MNLYKTKERYTYFIAKRVPKKENFIREEKDINEIQGKITINT